MKRAGFELLTNFFFLACITTFCQIGRKYLDDATEDRKKDERNGILVKPNVDFNSNITYFI